MTTAQNTGAGSTRLGPKKLIWDLRTSDGLDIREDALAIVWSILMKPHVRQNQNRMVDFANRDAGGQAGEAVRDRQIENAHKRCLEGCLAGGMLLNLVRLRIAQQDLEAEQTGKSPVQLAPSMNRAHLLLSDQIKGAQSKKQNLDCFRRFRRCTHLWATVYLNLWRELTALTDNNPPYAPDVLRIENRDDFVRFLHTADWLSIKASEISLRHDRSKKREPALEESKIWRFQLPGTDRPAKSWRPDLPRLTEIEFERVRPVAR